MISELNFLQRFVQGRVTEVFPTAIDVELSQPLNGVKMARIYREHWLDEQQVWHTSDPVPQMFIYDLSSDGKSGEGGGHWFASLKWLTPNRNPWADGHAEYPRVGKVFKAQVIQYAGERNAVLLLGSCLLKAYLSIDEIPNGSVHPLRELVPLGLMLQVVVTEVSPANLHVKVSVLRLIRDRERRQGKGPHAVGEASTHSEFLRFIEGDAAAPVLEGLPPVRVSQPDWQSKGILLIDNDKQFSQQLAAWCRQFGAQVWAVDTVRGVVAHLQNTGLAITHILLDYDLGAHQARTEYLTALKRRRVDTPIAVISGLPEIGAPEFATRSQMDFIAKPLPLKCMDDWLHGRPIPKWQHGDMKPAPYWQTKTAPLSGHLQHAVQAWLVAIQTQSRALALAWVRCFPPEYHVVDQIGFDEEQARHLRNAAFDQSVVVDTLVSERACNDTRRGMFPGVWPKTARQVWALPLRSHRNAAHVRDILLVFVAQPHVFPEEHKAAMPAWLGWWDSLLELQNAYLTLEDDTQFAAQGRVWAATAHELRPLLQPFESNQPWDHDTAMNFWPTGKRLNQLVGGALYNLRPYREQQVNLNDRMRTLAQTMLWQMIERSRITTIFQLPPANLVVHMAPEILEHVLINLLDNAAKACAKRKWAKIEVAMFLDYSNPDLPLVLRVADQGLGMRPETVRNLFQPRFSTSGEKGHGLGLYLCANLVEAVGGIFEMVETWYWSGTVFEMRLPLLVDGKSTGGESETDRFGG